MFLCGSFRIFFFGGGGAWGEGGGRLLESTYSHQIPLYLNNSWVSFLLQGLIFSDWSGLDRLSEPRGSNYRSCISSAVKAGIDMVEIESNSNA